MYISLAYQILYVSTSVESSVLSYTKISFATYILT